MLSWKIGDSLDLMKTIEDNSFDMVFTSPPFKDVDVDGDYWEFYTTFYNEAIRISKNLAIIIHSATKINEIVQRFPPKRVLIWGKGVVKYAWRYNPIYIYQIGDHYKVNKYIWSDVFGVAPLYGSNKAHKYQDPLLLYTTLLKMFKKNKTVLDPFLGSGTTLEACRHIGLDCMGFEIKPELESLYIQRSMNDINTIESYGSEY